MSMSMILDDHDIMSYRMVIAMEIDDDDNDDIKDKWLQGLLEE